MKCEIRKWLLSDKCELSEALNNKKVQDNLRDGLPYPYTPGDAEWYINEMLKADPNDTFAFAITVDGKVIGSMPCSVSRMSTAEQVRLAITSASPIGVTVI